MITYQHPLTVISPVDPLKLDQLQKLLLSIQNPDIEANTLVPFARIKTLHFARFVIIECETDKYPIQLAFSSDFDGEERAHIAEFIQEAEEGLNKIYNCCLGFNQDLTSYWAAHKIPINAFYNGHPGFSVEQVQQEDTLRNVIADYLGNGNLNGAGQPLSAVQIKKMVSTFIRENSSFEWAIWDQGLSSWQKFLFQRKVFLTTIAAGIIVLFLLGFSITKICKLLRIPVSVGFFVLFTSLGAAFFRIKQQLNYLENTDPVYQKTPPIEHVNDLLSAENFQVQNQLTHLVEIKPGRFRLRLLKLVLGSINFLARTFFNKGKLGSIPSIHFARWVIIDKNKRLIFFSNYDGSWEGYLGDFVDKAAIGLTAVWSNTNHFPKTRNLLQEGACDEQRFKEWARNLQISTQVWYSAYKKLSVQNVNNNALIRAGLFRKMNEAQAQAWLDQIFYYKS